MEICTGGGCGECAACREDPACAGAFPTPVARRAIVTGTRARRTGPRSTQVGARALVAKRRRPDVPVDTAVTRLAEFINIVATLDRAPWASLVFDVNDRMLRRLTATHLHLIVGKKLFARCDRPALLRLLDPSATFLDGFSNVIWVTNRQQGKTSTLAKFIAALAVHCHVGGHLAYIYSTNLDRANELSLAAKNYVDFLVSASPAHAHIRIVINNKTTFVVDNGVTQNRVVARPKNPNSCRGDAPEACFFDEVGFVGEDFWYKFAYPLLQVAMRVATCTTTPPPADGFFSTFCAMVAKANKDGDNFFHLENHSLSCSVCTENNEAERCCHRLHHLPPWKCVLRFVAMTKLIPKKQQATFRQEVYGVIAEAAANYFPAKLVDAAVGRARHNYTPGTQAVWVGIDPASHAVSDMAMVAIVHVGGMCVVVGTSNVNVARSDVAAVIAYVKVFLRRLRAKVGPLAPLVPVIEVNSSEILASSIGAAFREFPPVYMPFTEQHFQSCVLPGVGVRTTKDTKMMMAQHMYACLCEGRLVFAAAIAHVAAIDLAGNGMGMTADGHVDELAEQLKRMRDTDKGDISGKNQGGDNDDLAIALMLANYWSTCVRAAHPEMVEA